jgi:hypothetical protein
MEEPQASSSEETRIVENSSGEWKRQQPRAPHVALCMLPIVLCFHSPNDPIEPEPRIPSPYSGFGCTVSG